MSIKQKFYPLLEMIQRLINMIIGPELGQYAFVYLDSHWYVQGAS